MSESALGGLCIDGKLTFSNNAYPFCPRSVPVLSPFCPRSVPVLSPFCPTNDRTLRSTRLTCSSSSNSADSLAATHSTGPSFCRRTFDQFVRKALVVSFTMVVGDELSQSPTKVRFAQRDDTLQALLLTERTNRSACALQFGALGGVRTTRTPAVKSHCSTALLHFGSRSQTKIFPLCKRASDSFVTDRRHWMTKASSGYGVEPRICTRRDCNSITNAV